MLWPVFQVGSSQAESSKGDSDIFIQEVIPGQERKDRALAKPQAVQQYLYFPVVTEREPFS